MDFLRPEAFFDLSSIEFGEIFQDHGYVWEALEEIPSYLEKHLHSNVAQIGNFGIPLEKNLVIWQGRVLDRGFELLKGDVTKGKFRVRIGSEETSKAAVLFAGSVLWDDRIFIGPGAVIEPGALVKGPTMIGPHTEVRQGAYIRGKCLIGARCVVGHTTEIKSSIMLNGAKAGHFAYIGDSILGSDSNLGAGTKLANLKIQQSNVRVNVRGNPIDTGLRKFGAVIGDGVEIGCNTVTNPGVLLGKSCMVYPLTSVAPGYYEPKTLVRS